jgi:hypothetical protein
MARILDSHGGPDYLMDYGAEWPPPPTRVSDDEAGFPPMTLAKKCAAWVIVYTAIAIVALLVLHFKQEALPPSFSSHPDGVSVSGAPTHGGHR